MAQEIVIRQGKGSDSNTIVALIGELARMEHYNKWMDDKNSFQKDGFGASPWFHTFVAETETQGVHQLIGLGLYYYCYSMLHGRCVHMEVLYVNAEHRGKGIGTKLWKAIAKAALENGCNTMDIGVQQKNVKAMKLYKSYGAFDFTDEAGVHVLFMNRPEMQKLAES